MSGQGVGGSWPDPVWLTHAVGLLGTALLALPVLRLDRLGRRLDRLERLAPRDPDDPRWRDLHGRLVGALQRRRQAWSPASRVCLWAGYALLLGSQLGRLWLTA